jgi:hypothetical protein
LWPSPEAAKEGIKSIWDHADIIKVWHQWSIETCLGTHTLVDLLISLYMPNFVLFPSTLQHLFWGRWNIHNYKVHALKLLFFALGNSNLLPQFFHFSWQGKISFSCPSQI